MNHKITQILTNLICLFILFYPSSDILVRSIYSDHMDNMYLAGNFFPRSSSSFGRSPFRKMYRNQQLNTDSKTSDIKKLDYYHILIKEIKMIQSINKFKAFKSIKNINVLIHWQIGEHILRFIRTNNIPQDKEKTLFQQLSNDLSLTVTEIENMFLFFNYYQTISLVSLDLSWSHYKLLIDISNGERRLFFQKQAIIHLWQTSELQRNITNQLINDNSRPKNDD